VIFGSHNSIQSYGNLVWGTHNSIGGDNNCWLDPFAKVGQWYHELGDWATKSETLEKATERLDRLLAEIYEDRFVRFPVCAKHSLLHMDHGSHAVQVKDLDWSPMFYRDDLTRYAAILAARDAKRAEEYQAKMQKELDAEEARAQAKREHRNELRRDNYHKRRQGLLDPAASASAPAINSQRAKRTK